MGASAHRQPSALGRTLRSATTKLHFALSAAGSVPLRTLDHSLRAILTAAPGATLLQHPAYVPIADVADLPRVLLLGDSISIGYTVTVRRALKGIANVHRPAVNCGSSRNGASLVNDWLGAGRWDMVHCNFGLHDCVRDNGEPAVPLEEYCRNLRWIFDRLRTSGASVMWAGTTAVPADLAMHNAATGRLIEYRVEDIAAYNDAAAGLALEAGFTLDGLEEWARPRLDALQDPGDIHFTEDGYRALGRQVAGVLREQLQKDKGKVEGR